MKPWPPTLWERGSTLLANRCQHSGGDAASRLLTEGPCNLQPMYVTCDVCYQIRASGQICSAWESNKQAGSSLWALAAPGAG